MGSENKTIKDLYRDSAEMVGLALTACGFDSIKAARLTALLLKYAEMRGWLGSFVVEANMMLDDDNHLKVVDKEEGICR